MSTDALDLLFTELVDDAALFPPGDATMAEAVPAYLRNDAGPYGRILGRFLCPVSNLDELRATMPVDADMRLGLIADTGLDELIEAFDAIEDDDRFMLEAAEIRHPGERLAELEAALPYGVEAYVEIAPGPEAKSLIAGLAGHEWLRAKLRTGGLNAEAFPSPKQVADFILACSDLGVSFKCTAGLHNSIRHTDEETGFTHFGFLNILRAVAVIPQGPEAVETVLDGTDADLFFTALSQLSVESAAQARDLFHGFGSCSFTEPVEDLLAVGYRFEEN